MRIRRIIPLFIGLWLLALPGCSGQLYKVAPRPVVSPSDFPAGTASGNLEVSAFALTDDDRAFEQFGANLPLAGLVAVDVKLTNRTASPINSRSLRFELSDATGAKFKQLEPKKALGRLMKFYGVRFYALEARRVTRERFETLSLPLAAPLAPQEERRGLLFFEVKRDVAGLVGLTLSIAGKDRTIPAPVTVRLN
ncbi:MAG TPA: hypothetical protein VFD58_08625 [Blastocatellia bacterium]|nr:hypothetical protein [Blastocatellia bacterium]